MHRTAGNKRPQRATCREFFSHRQKIVQQPVKSSKNFSTSNVISLSVQRTKSDIKVQKKVPQCQILTDSHFIDES